MREEAERLWGRARECRIKAETARAEPMRKELLKLADELEAKAMKVEAETAEAS
jgi:hypothetical protein